MSSVRLVFLFEVEENEAEEEHPDHHGEGAGVVGIGRRDEPLVLGVLQWPHRHLNI